MPNYTFDVLSPYDLELLARDLLQAEFGLLLESFAPGRDHGIDLRFASGPTNDIIVQCKHYARSSWADLRRSLQADIGKIRVLAPRRYIVVTSLPLTPARKAWVCNAFAPFCSGPGDVLGAEDLNNLLGLHPDVERRHHKLWLTSAAILEQTVSSDVFSDQFSEISHIRRRISRFVSNPSVTRTLDILSDRHFCVITGIPGIGKTTLAEMIVIDHLARGFECFRIWDDLGDARKVFSSGRKQLFYYDDFLGRTGLRNLDKNEDERLLRFIHDVAQSNNHRLLLTTREYILNQARSILEGLTRVDLDPAKCVVSLADYTSQIRAAILYNHLYHSAIPHEHINALVESRTYRAIVRHSNYSPRLVEMMTDLVNVRDIPHEEYPAAFVANLANPQRLWQIAYTKHLTLAAQHALLVVASLADQVRIADAAEAFQSFHHARCAQYGQPHGPYDWTRALKEVEGTFLTIAPSHGSITLRFHNPSVRDFLEHGLRENSKDVTDLIPSAVFPDQLTHLARILRTTPDRHWVLPCLHRFIDIFHNRSSIGQVYQIGHTTEWRDRTESPIMRLLSFARLASLAPPKQSATVSGLAVTFALKYIESSIPDREDLARLLDSIIKGEIPHVRQADPLYDAAFEKAFSTLDDPDMTLDEYDAIVAFACEHSAAMPADVQDRLRSPFAHFADQELDVLDQFEPDMRLSIYDQLETVAARLGLTLSKTRDALLEELDYWPDTEDNSPSIRDNGTAGDLSDSDLDAMFHSLLS